MPVLRHVRIGVGLTLIFLPLLLNFFWIHPGVSQTNLPVPSHVPGYNYAPLPRISSIADPRLQRRDGESSVDFADRILRVVNLATYHCSVDDFRQSWWTWLAAKAGLFDLTQGVLTTSTFICGFCHQRAFILAKALRRGGLIDAAAYGLNGHVITIYSANGKRYAIDADYGVRSFEFPKNSDVAADVIAAHYSTEAPGFRPDVYTKVSNFYSSSDDNHYYLTYAFLNQISRSQRRILRLEPVIGSAIFVFGVGVLFGPALLARGRKRRARLHRKLRRLIVPEPALLNRPE